MLKLNANVRRQKLLQKLKESDKNRSVKLPTMPRDKDFSMKRLESMLKEKKLEESHKKSSNVSNVSAVKGKKMVNRVNQLGTRLFVELQEIALKHSTMMYNSTLLIL